MTRYPLLVSIVFAVLFGTSCSSGPHDPKERYVLVAANTKIPYWQEAQAGVKRAAAELKVRAEMSGPDGYNPRGERDQLRGEIQDKPSGILISAANPSLMADDINSAIDQGIPVITIDSDVPNSKRLFFIGTDNYSAGVLGGQLLVKLLNGKGNVVIFTYPNQQNLIERQHGYMSTFENHPDIKVTQGVDIQGDPTIAHNTAKQLIDAKAKVDAFVCLEAVGCPEIADVVNSAGLGGKVTIVAMDTDERTLNWIEKGVISATIAQKPFTMAYLGVKMLDQIHHHPPAALNGNFAQNSFSPLPTVMDTGAFIIDKGNVQSFIQQQKQQQQAQEKH